MREKNLKLYQQHTILPIRAWKEKEITVPKNTSISFFGVVSRGWSEERTLTFSLERGAHLSLSLVMIGSGEDQFHWRITCKHEAQSESSLVIRSLLSDRATIQLDGRVVMSPNAGESQAFFSHRALLLSRDARVKTVPSLEICTDRVNVRHEASVSRLDEETLFYLQSRSLSHQAAQSLLTHSFLRSAAHAAPSAVRSRLFQRLNTFYA